MPNDRVSDRSIKRSCMRGKRVSKVCKVQQLSEVCVNRYKDLDSQLSVFGWATLERIAADAAASI